jgi:hypothetical protein
MESKGPYLYYFYPATSLQLLSNLWVSRVLKLLIFARDGQDVNQNNSPKEVSTFVVVPCFATSLRSIRSSSSVHKFRILNVPSLCIVLHDNQFPKPAEKGAIGEDN